MSLPLPTLPAAPAADPASAAALAAAVQLLAERGWHGLALDDVADRAGLPVTRLRATWPSLSALVGEAVATVPVVVDRGDTGSTARDLGAALEHWSRPLGRGELAVAAVAEAAGRDPLLRAGVEVAVTDAVCEVMCAVAARARRRAEPIGAARQQWITAVLGGAVWERITGRGRPVPAHRRAELVESILACA
ncbi:transcriptional regulator, TetR family [Klenkia soli]|uniref:Transcriptional regulator, TetR family n=1 Tax=Klenkia soli TaxID=1052260 RepID=A0A1H0TWX0_9ACTN|nr:TetR family transcriptional regulator [Klenkia soli]SDP58567.1 transcriptional regulator, TetR family [Klenkia soli]